MFTSPSLHAQSLLKLLYKSNLARLVLGVGLIPLGVDATDHARAIFVLRPKDESADAEQAEQT